MNTMKRFFAYLPFFLLLFPMLLQANAVFENSIDVAKDKAAIEGKLILLDFTASWCAPCKFMDEFTFPDTEIDQYLQTSFVPVKVDIDSFDGYNLKVNYDVQYLPTIIILNSKGEFLAKYVESLPPTRLREILALHDQPTHKVITKTRPVIEETPISNEPVIETPIYETPEQATETAPTYETPQLPSPTVPSPTYEAPVTEPSLPSNTDAAPLVTGNGLFKFNVEVQPSSGYSVQIGAFYEYENVLLQVSQLQQRYDYIIVNANRLNGKPIYKILLGHYNSANDARLFVENLAINGMTGSFVVDLGRLK